LLPINELVLEDVEVFVIEMELQLEGAIHHTTTPPFPPTDGKVLTSWK
jgi:hypothetical protein